MNRREFAVAALALVGAWLTGHRVAWRRIFAETREVPVIATMTQGAFNEVYRKIQGKLLKGFHDMQPEWDAFMETELGRLGTA
jgi:hypothetical protein